MTIILSKKTLSQQKVNDLFCAYESSGINVLIANKWEIKWAFSPKSTALFSAPYNPKHVHFVPKTNLASQSKT